MIKKILVVKCASCSKSFGGAMLITLPDKIEFLYENVYALVVGKLEEKGWRKVINLREVLANDTEVLLSICPECSLKLKGEKDKK